MGPSEEIVGNSGTFTVYLAIFLYVKFF